MAGTSAVASVESTEAQRKGRPRGPRFGTLVHTLLARAPFDAEGEAVATLSASMARFLGATPEEDAAAIEAVTAALTHPIMRQARPCRSRARWLGLQSLKRRPRRTCSARLADGRARPGRNWTRFSRAAGEPPRARSAVTHVFDTDVAVATVSCTRCGSKAGLVKTDTLLQRTDCRKRSSARVPGGVVPSTDMPNARNVESRATSAASAR
jgi:hypothetical protein